MSGVLKTVAKVAGVVALVAGTIATAGIGTAAFAAVASTVATAAGLAAGFATIGAQALAKRPPAQGSVTQVTVAANSETPCIIGETYYGGVLRHDVGYGGKVGKVQNPYRGMVIVYSLGLVQGLVSMHADFVTVPFSGSAATGYYSEFMYRDYQLGASPEASALTPQWGGMPGWGASYKLSGRAAILWGLKFDKDGKKYTSGVPQLGAVWQGVMAYDPTADSTRPGGSGSQRIDDESTWAYSENPRDHALSYIYGRHVDGRKVFGIGLPEDAIDIAAFTAWGNVCETNGWKVGGVIFEPGDRWANLKRIMAAGSAEPIFAGGVLSVKYDAPRVSLATITPDDYADGTYRTKGMQTWRDRINTIVPKYRSGAHKWEYVESDAITDAGYLAEDGEEKIDTYQIDLCQDKDQAAQLAAYKLVNGREMFPIERNLKPEFRFYRPGDMVTIDDPEGGLIEQDCVIVRRSVDPQTLAVRVVLMSETTDKHDFALGKTGTAPPTPTLLDPADRDDVAGENTAPSRGAFKLTSQTVLYPVTSDDNSIDIVAFDGVIDDGRAISFPADTSLTGLASGTKFGVFWDLATSEYVATAEPSIAEMASSDYVFIGWTATSTGGTYPTPDTRPPGWGGGGGGWDNPIP